MAPTCDVDLYAYEQFGIKEFPEGRPLSVPFLLRTSVNLTVKLARLPEGARTHTFYQTDILQP